MTMPTIGLPPHRIFAYGDSKTSSWSLGKFTYRYEWELRYSNGMYACQGQIGHSTYSVEDCAGVIDADLEAKDEKPIPTAILLNVGVNAMASTTDEDFTTYYAYILDAMHTKWPTALVYCARIWKQAADAEADNIANVLLPGLLASRPWARIGIDERVVLKGDDDGATYTLDGVHPNVAGYTRWNDAYAAIL